MKAKSSLYLLIISSILTLITLAVILFRYDIFPKSLKRLGWESQVSDINNQAGGIQKGASSESLFATCKTRNIKIVMLGDSITYGGDWRRLLSRNDIANKGVRADTTKDFLKRLSEIYDLKPELCFIMGGINDIARKVPVETIFSNYIKIITGLRSRNIRPVVQSTLYVSAKRPDWKERNRKVDELNRLLEAYCKANGIRFIDVNKELSINGALNPVFTYDGVHLSGNGYAIWRELILKELGGI